MANTVKFKRFCGTLAKWNERVNSGVWGSTIVFGKVWNNAKWEHKIYAGKKPIDASTDIDFIYDIPSKQTINEIENSIQWVIMDENNNNE